MATHTIGQSTRERRKIRPKLGLDGGEEHKRGQTESKKGEEEKRDSRGQIDRSNLDSCLSTRGKIANARESFW